MTKKTQKSKSDKPIVNDQDIKVPLANLKVGAFARLQNYERGLIAVYKKKGKIVAEEMPDHQYHKLKNNMGHRIKAVRYQKPAVKGPYMVSLRDLNLTNTRTFEYRDVTITAVHGAHGTELHMVGTRDEVVQKLHDLAHDPKSHSADFYAALASQAPAMREKSKNEAWAKADEIADQMRQKLEDKKAARAARRQKIANAPAHITSWVRNELHEMANILFSNGVDNRPAPEQKNAPLVTKPASASKPKS